eukprot:CAMPEP_0113616272 /NCGR_PEP_ID=MMETSP0017_2-20120614/8154_1 /TAXON_ID=2856 /ORGANISM="Cylindrotheca closterium" /LENGTH=106 /DNA_ID=CAMNT_0000525581 /DNA_START=98 /DNA_END=418 /DNA_ORIENTATION=+ /assembly_acc=CAM_ASM_000147
MNALNLNEKIPSSSSTTSCSKNVESSINGAIRMFSSPLPTPKNVAKPNNNAGGVPTLARRGYLVTPKRSCELLLDNANYLSGLMSKCNRSKPELDYDYDYESDFDE